MPTAKIRTTEDASKQAASSSILRHIFLGFHPASLEERFQQEQFKGAKATRLLANAFWSVASCLVAWDLLRHPNLPRGVVGRCFWLWLVFLQPLLLHCLWLVLSLRARLQLATRWRTALLAAFRLHAVTGRLLGEGMMIRRYLNGEGLVEFVINYFLTSGAFIDCVTGYYFTMPLRFHLPLELMKTAIFLLRTSSICQSCSSDMKERFSALSSGLGRVLTGAAVLQTDSEFSVPPRDAACSAVSAFLILSAASLSSALLGCREAWKRYDFLVSHAAQPDKELSLLQMRTNLSLLPVSVVMLAIPALSLLWVSAVTLSSII